MHLWDPELLLLTVLPKQHIAAVPIRQSKALRVTVQHHWLLRCPRCGPSAVWWGDLCRGLCWQTCHVPFTPPPPCYLLGQEFTTAGTLSPTYTVARKKRALISEGFLKGN